MNARTFDPRRLDVAAFAEQQGQLAGELPLSQLQRLSDFTAPEGAPGSLDTVSWRARGEARPGRAQQPPHLWLHLTTETVLTMTCQRCLQPMPVPLNVARDLRFVEGKDAAAAEDADSEDDVLALTAHLNLHTLIEDELVLGLPWVPRHDACPEPLVVPSNSAGPEQAPDPHPFQAALAQLKKRLDS
ncbi:MAG: DUF177 domain-containing protein [Pseudomonadota bacterium]